MSPAVPPLAGRWILVIDDEPALCDMLARALVRAGAIVSTAHSSRAALAALQCTRFDLALVDKRLGGEDGVALIAPLLEQQPRLAVVIMTGFASVDDSLAALDAGAVGYLLKPFRSLDDVVRELEDILAQEERRRRATAPPANTATTTQRLGRRSQPPQAASGAGLVLLVLLGEVERIRCQRALEERGFACERAAGMPALSEALTRRAYDAIVVDAELAGAAAPSGGITDDGVVALERARSSSRKAELVLIGGTPSLEVMTRLLRLGQAAFVRRPVDASDLVGRIERILARERA